MNKLQLIGRTTKKPELQVSKSGQAYTIITLAVDDKGNDKKLVDFIDIKAFGKVAEILNKFVDKGQQLYIEAKAKQNVYELEDGTKKYSIDFILQEFEFIGSATKAEDKKAEDKKAEDKEEDEEDEEKTPNESNENDLP